MNDIEGKLKSIFNDFGVDLINNPFKLYAIFSDYYPNDLIERKVLKGILQADINLAENLKAVQSDEQMDSLIAQLVKPGLNETIIRTFIESFSSILGVRNKSNNATHVTKKQNKTVLSNENLDGILNHNKPQNDPIFDDTGNNIPHSGKTAFTQTTSSGNRTVNQIKKKHHFWLPIVLALVVLPGYFGIGLYQSNSYIADIRAGVSNETSFFETMPFMESILDWRLKATVNKTVKSYNKGKSGYEETAETVSSFTSSEIGKYAQKKLSLLEKLSASKQAYKQGIEQSDNENYIGAAQSLSNVIKEDSLYKKAMKKKKKIKKDFTKDLTSEIENAVANADYTEAVTFANIGGDCYPSDNQLAGLKKAGNDCGNPFIYQIVHNIYKDIKKVEKDKDNKKQDCYSMMVFKLDDTHFLLGALFGTVEGSGVSDYSIVCYDITPDDISEISQSEYQASMEGKGKLKKLEFKWEPDISKKDKEENLYTQFIKMGPNYEGDTSGISYINKSEPAQKSDGNQPSYLSVLGWAGIEFFGIAASIAIMGFALKKFISG